MKVKELIKSLEKYDANDEVAQMIWRPVNVRVIADKIDLELYLTDKEVRETLKYLDEESDCDIGINNEIVKKAIKTIVKRRGDIYTNA